MNEIVGGKTQRLETISLAYEPLQASRLSKFSLVKLKLKFKLCVFEDSSIQIECDPMQLFCLHSCLACARSHSLYGVVEIH